MEGSSEVWLALIGGLLGAGGIIGLLIKYYAEVYLKRMEYAHEREQQSLELPLRESLKGLDHQYDMVHSLKTQHQASFVTILRLTNGEVFADKTHRWQFTATASAGNDKIRQKLQNRSIYEAPQFFSKLEQGQPVIIQDVNEFASVVLVNRLVQEGVTSFLMVASDDCMKITLACWTELTAISKETADIFKAELLAVEPYIK